MEGFEANNSAGSLRYGTNPRYVNRVLLNGCYQLNSRFPIQIFGKLAAATLCPTRRLFSSGRFTCILS